jgi:DNA-binding SARP family transcriptional activator
VTEFRILGPIEVLDAGRPLPLGGPLQRALLALLLTRANEVVSTDRLVYELWGESPPRTAANALQYHVSQLRKMPLLSEAIVTREPGYLIRIAPDELDLLRFEQLVSEAREAAPDRAAALLREAGALWRGPPLADVDHDAVRAEIRRLEELRLEALERRLEADLALGGGPELVAELETLVREHPLRERLRACLMRALYSSGRQAEALDAYRQTRALLVDELGIEPSPELQELEQAILRQDPTLAGARRPGALRRRAIMVVADDESGGRLDDLVAVAAPLARGSGRELILARLLATGGDLGAINADLAGRRTALAERGVEARVAAYTSPEPGAEAVLLAREQDVDLVLAAATPAVLDGVADGHIATVLDAAPCDVGLLAGGRHRDEGAVVAPFGGVEHDWTAIEVAAWLARSLDTTLRLLGTEADLSRGRRDASRLLARASMLVQQVVGIVTEPVLVPPGEEGVLKAAQDARLLVVGLSDRWRSEGIGRTRRGLAAGAASPVLFVRRGLRPGGVAPDETFTRFTWTLASQHPDEPAR